MPSKMHLNEYNVAAARILNLFCLIKFFLSFKSSSLDPYESIGRLRFVILEPSAEKARDWLFLRSQCRGDRLAEGAGLGSWHRAFQRKQ